MPVDSAEAIYVVQKFAPGMVALTLRLIAAARETGKLSNEETGEMNDIEHTCLDMLCALLGPPAVWASLWETRPGAFRNLHPELEGLEPEDGGFRAALAILVRALTSAALSCKRREAKMPEVDIASHLMNVQAATDYLGKLRTKEA